MDLYALVLQYILHRGGNFFLKRIQDARQRLDHRDLFPEGTVQRGKFDTDHTAADDHDTLRQGLACQDAVGIHDAFLIDPRDRNTDRFGSGRQDHLLCSIRFPVYGETVLSGKCCRPVQDRDLAGFHKRAHTAAQLLDDLVFPFGDLLIIHGDVFCQDPQAFAFLNDLFVDLCGMQQRLRGDTSPVQAGAAHLPVLHNGRFQAQLRAANRCHIATGAGAQNSHVKIISRWRCRGGGYRSFRLSRLYSRSGRYAIFCRSTAFLSGLCQDGGDILAFISYDTDDLGDRYDISFAMDDRKERSRCRCVHRDRQFVGFHFK